MPSSTSTTDEIQFEGPVTGVRFTNPDTGFTIFEIEDKKIGKIILKGEAPPLSRGIKVSGEGTFVKDPKWGNQIDVKSIKKTDPDSNDGIEAYLIEHVENIGPVMAKRLVTAFGSKTLEVIRKQPERVREVPGIGAQRAEAISNAANALIEAERVMVFLNGHGITGSVAMKLYREYGNKTLETIKADPWITADHIDGIGFLTADRMAATMGMTGAHPGRIRAGLIYALKQGESEGHTGLTKDSLCIETAKLLQLSVADRALTRRIDELVHAKELMIGDVRFRAS
ncbi:helix-hairpin-helix domain-containing protein, partial [Nevskia ramosa]|uniref:helix-hairpin-helix domain-containing protein n=1 Tax=Nevskia ramosa TaxID=64002 RepID=UPI0023551EEB